MFLVVFLIFGKFVKIIRFIVIKEKVNEYVKVVVSMGVGVFWVLRKYIFFFVGEFFLRYLIMFLVKVVVLILVFGFFGLILGMNWGFFMIEVMS